MGPGGQARDFPVRWRKLFRIHDGPGERREAGVSLGNFGNEPIEARTFAADVYTIVGGGFGARLRGEPRAGASLWLDYKEDVMLLEPGQAVTRTFSITVPANTLPGEYIASLILENENPVSEEESAGSGVTIKRVQRQAIAAAVTVPGPLTPALTFGRASHRDLDGGSVVSVGLENKGNAMLKPSGTILINDSKGSKVAESKVAMDSFYAFTATSIEFPMKKRLKAGRYTANLELKDDRTSLVVNSEPLPFRVGSPTARRIVPPGGRSLTDLAEDKFDGLPPWALPLAAALLIAALLLAARRRRGKRRKKAPISIFH